MKTLLIRGVLTAFLGLTAASMSAQTQSTTSSSTTYIEASKIVGTRVKSSDGQEVGTIKDVVLDLRENKILVSPRYVSKSKNMS